MQMFVVVMMIVVWLLADVALAIAALERIDDRGWRDKRGIGFAFAALVMFAAPFGMAASYFDADTYANRLCREGHQEWRTTHRPMMPVGKVIIPGNTATSKVWVCDRWEQ